MAGWRQPGLIRAPPAGGRGRFEVSRCRALRPPGRPRRQAVGPGLAAGPAARVYPGAGWGLGAGILFPPGPSGTSKRSAGSEEASGWGAGLRAGILLSAGPRPPVGCRLGPLSPAPPPESALLSAHCVPGAALCSSCAYELLTLHYSYRVRRCNAPHFTGEETSSERWRPCQTPPGPLCSLAFGGKPPSSSGRPDPPSRGHSGWNVLGTYYVPGVGLAVGSRVLSLPLRFSNSTSAKPSQEAGLSALSISRAASRVWFSSPSIHLILLPRHQQPWRHRGQRWSPTPRLFPGLQTESVF